MKTGLILLVIQMKHLVIELDNYHLILLVIDHCILMETVSHPVSTWFRLTPVSVPERGLQGLQASLEPRRRVGAGVVHLGFQGSDLILGMVPLDLRQVPMAKIGKNGTCKSKI